LVNAPRSRGCALPGCGNRYNEVHLLFMRCDTARAEIFSGVCGFMTVVETKMDGEVCRLQIQSNCKAVQELAQNLDQVDPMREISTRRAMPATLAAGHQFCSHAACPVPVGIIKAIEVEAGLALPKDVTIKISQ